MEKHKKMLLVGGGMADIPMIISSKKLGFHVITTGNRPEDAGHAYADEYCSADFSDYNAIYRLAKKKNVTALCPSCNDFAALAASYAAGLLGLPGHDPYKIAKILHHKDCYRKFARENNIRSPKAENYCSVDDARLGLQKVTYPSLVKPVDLTGGKGISVINSPKEGILAIKKAFEISKAKRIVIEEYIEGSHHGFSSIICEGKVVFSFFDDEYYYLNSFMVSATSTPGSITNHVKDDLIEQAELIAKLLNLTNGIFHVQYILKDNHPVIIEICRRPPGDLYVKFVELATGVNFSKWIVKLFAGMDCSNEICRKFPSSFFTRHCIMADKQGAIDTVIFDEKIKDNIVEYIQIRGKGDIIGDFLTDKIGIVFFKFQSKDEMIEKSYKMNELIQVKVLRSN